MRVNDFWPSILARVPEHVLRQLAIGLTVYTPTSDKGGWVATMEQGMKLDEIGYMYCIHPLIDKENEMELHYCNPYNLLLQPRPKYSTTPAY